LLFTYYWLPIYRYIFRSARGTARACRAVWPDSKSAPSLRPPLLLAVSTARHRPDERSISTAPLFFSFFFTSLHIIAHCVCVNNPVESLANVTRRR
jgi:hypothetical protein